MIGALLALALAAVPAPSTTIALPAQGGRPTVILAPRPGMRAALVVRFQVGSVDDGGADGSVPGLTHLTQLTLLRANARLDHMRFIQDLFESDGELTIVTSLEWCEFRMEAAAADFDRLAARLVEALLAPALQGGEPFEGAREKALHDRRESRGGEFLAALAHLALPDPAYGSPPNGDRASLEGISPEEVRRHAARRFTPASATLAFAGAFDVRAARVLAVRHAGGLQPVRPRPEVLTPFAMQAPSRREVYMVAFRGEQARSRLPAARVLAALLEERLHDELRGRGIGYAEGVEVLEEPWLPGIILVVPGRDTGREPVGPLVEKVLARVRAGEFQDADVERSRAWVLGELERLDRRPGELAVTLARRPVSPQRGAAEASGPALADQVARVDRDALVAAAGELLRESNSIRVFLNPEATRSGPIPESFRVAGGRP